MTSHIQDFLDSPEIALEDPLPFSCRGCGLDCCTTSSAFVLSPSEYARILWTVEAMHWPERDWADITVGLSSGFPCASFHFRPIDPGDPSSAPGCPFLIPYGNSRLAFCAIHRSRPSTCRLFPLGRGRNGDPKVAVAVPFSYRRMGNCVGFQKPGPEDVVYDGYRPIDPRQTAGDWLKASLDPEMDQEVDLWYGKVFFQFLNARVYAATFENWDGMLSPSDAQWMGEKLLYNPPARPASEGDWHATLMEWLNDLSMIAQGAHHVLDAFPSTPPGFAKEYRRSFDEWWETVKLAGSRG